MTNPLLSKVKMPGRVFQLPSKGVFYDPGVLADSVKDGEITVRPLSALAELKFRSPDLLFSGKALTEICEECIPEILAPERLISKDVDAIFCFLRIVTYGAEMNVRSIHNCKDRQMNTYPVNVEAIVTNPNNSCLDHRDLLYKVKLGNGQIVNLRPVTFQDSLDIIHMRQELEKTSIESGETNSRLLEKMVIRDVMSVIKSVATTDEEGNKVTISDPSMIEAWVRVLQKKFIDSIIEQAKKTNEWGFNLTVKLKCKDCGEEYDHDLELDPINFFSG